FLKNLKPAQIAGGVLAGGLILGGMVYVHRRYEFNQQYQSETSSSSDSETEALPAVEHVETP
ncbi:hypothetical protein J6590_013635, partial [Homalodisca vitripennis]